MVPRQLPQRVREGEPFGHKAGYLFVKDGCLDEDGSVPSALRENFYNSPISMKESGNQTCDPSRCDLNSHELLQIGNNAAVLEEAPDQFLYDKDT